MKKRGDAHDGRGYAVILLRLALALGFVLASYPILCAAGDVVIEDWSSHAVGTRGIPAGWERCRSSSKGVYDFTVIEKDGMKVMHMQSRSDSSRISKVIKDVVDLDKTPILEWKWKVTTLPKGGDSRSRKTDDKAAQLYVTWPRFPETVRSRVIGYIWNNVPTDKPTFKSHKSPILTYIVVRSGPTDVGVWLTESRNVREDYKMVYGEEPESPSVITFGCDSNDTGSSAESYMGSILFKKQGPVVPKPVNR